MIKRNLIEDHVATPVGAAELARAVDFLLDAETSGVWTFSATPLKEQPRRMSGFAHVGSITEHGRVSYTKLTAVFGSARYPRSNCGISVLGV